MTMERIAGAVRDIPDFPKPGVVYKDITPLLKDAKLFGELIGELRKRCPEGIDYIAGIEARGFILGSALALSLGCGFIPVRKKGKLPYRTVSESYALEYGVAEIEVHCDAVERGSRVLLVDDVLATGGTAAAAARLLEKIGADVIGINVLLELSFLKGREVLGAYPVDSLITV